VEVIADHDGKQAGDIYDAFDDKSGLGYTRYSEIINKLDQLGIIDADYTDVEGRGRSRQLTLNYDADAVLERL
jgi:cell division control protein 6